LHVKDRPLLTGRNQLVLDLTHEDVSEYLFTAIDKLLNDHAIDYLKWDMNRDLVTPGSSRNQGAAVYRRQTQALYALLDRFRNSHPEVEIESCASGAGRADYGVLAYTHRIWTSDNNDPLERQTIQRGFLRFFPPEIMGAHIGPSPAHIGYRRHTLAFRAATALFGHLGLELDVRTLSEEERAELKIWIETYKRFRELLHSGKTHQLTVRKDAGRGGHGVVAPDKSEALFAVVQLAASRLRVSQPVRLPGLDGDASYRLALAGAPPPYVKFETQGLRALKEGTLRVPGALLHNVGLQIPILPPETALLLHLQRA
jgi:alpha-galactosidase